MKENGSAAAVPEPEEFASGDLDTPTSDQRALAILRRMIVDGSIAPGEKITEVGIAALLDMSRTPVRLALKTLEVEGFIRKRDGRGYTVVAIELEDVSKAYEVRGVLEGLAAKLLAQKEGILTGISGGSTFAVSLQVADKAPAGSVILCMLPDTGERYLSTPLFEDIHEDMDEEERALSHSTPGYQMD